jgi:hypothetical protein
MDATMAQAAGLQIYTIGHSTRALDELRAMLQTHGVDRAAQAHAVRARRGNADHGSSAQSRFAAGW